MSHDLLHHVIIRLTKLCLTKSRMRKKCFLYDCVSQIIVEEHFFQYCFFHLCLALAWQENETIAPKDIQEYVY